MPNLAMIGGVWIQKLQKIENSSNFLIVKFAFALLVKFVYRRTEATVYADQGLCPTPLLITCTT